MEVAILDQFEPKAHFQQHGIRFQTLHEEQRKRYATVAKALFCLLHTRWLQPLLTRSTLDRKGIQTAKDHPVAAEMAAVGAVGLCAPGVIMGPLLPLAGFGKGGVAAGK